MKVAAYQAPLHVSDPADAVASIRRQIRACESEGVAFLCCPEAVLGGLADYGDDPGRFAIDVAAGGLGEIADAFASETVTTLFGFTERAGANRLFNSAAIVHRGAVAGVYRKVHPALRRSVYAAGNDAPVFRVGVRTFGIVICNDSNFPELPRRMAEQGATLLFVPTNNGLPVDRSFGDLVEASRRIDVAHAIANRVAVVRADMAGRTEALASSGSTHIVDRGGRVVQSARANVEDCIIAEIDEP